VTPRVVAFGQASIVGRTPIALGSAPSTGIIRVRPDPAGSTNISVVYRDITGAIVETLKMVLVLSAGWFDYDLSAGTAVKSDGTNLVGSLDSASQFFALEGDYNNSAWPTLETTVTAGTAATAQLIYRKAYA
jgi:hypothetical protein